MKTEIVASFIEVGSISNVNWYVADDVGGIGG